MAGTLRRTFHVARVKLIGQNAGLCSRDMNHQDLQATACLEMVSCLS
jgi:hypothetical protein